MLIPDTTDNTPNYLISINFDPYDYGEIYADAITTVEVDGVEYRNTEGQNILFQVRDYAIELNTYYIPELQSRGNHEIIIKADGYLDAVITQFITASSIYGEECTTLAGPTNEQNYNNGQSLPEIKVQLKDRYGNELVDGPDAGIVLNVEIPQGYGGGSTLSGTLNATADANGQITFDNIVVDLPDGITQVSNVALKFTGNNSFGNGVELYLTDPGTDNWAVFTVIRP
jgi:hypothetical protein